MSVHESKSVRKSGSSSESGRSRHGHSTSFNSSHSTARSRATGGAESHRSASNRPSPTSPSRDHVGVESASHGSFGLASALAANYSDSHLGESAAAASHLGSGRNTSSPAPGAGASGVSATQAIGDSRAGLDEAHRARPGEPDARRSDRPGAARRARHARRGHRSRRSARARQMGSPQRNQEANPNSPNAPAGNDRGRNLARIAERGATGRGGYCYRYVKQHLRNAGLANLSGRSAYMAADQLARNRNFQEVRGMSRQDLRNLPQGAVVVWNRGAGHPHGHVSVALGNGREASDKLRNQITNYPSSYRVFMPRGADSSTSASDPTTAATAASSQAVGTRPVATQTGGSQAQGVEPTTSVNAPFGTSGSRYSGQTYRSRGTGYYPHNSRMEGGHFDRKGRPLHTLQDYLAGRAPYVSVAMDHRAGIPYGQKLRIKELEERYGRPIEFRVVDTGGAFVNRGTSRIDICVSNRAQTVDPLLNGPLTLQFQ